MTTVIKISRGYTFDTWEFDCCGEQSGTFHADPDNPETNSIAGRNCLRRSRKRFGFQKHGAASQGSSCNSSGRLQELAARKNDFTHWFDSPVRYLQKINLIANCISRSVDGWRLRSRASRKTEAG